MWNRFWIFCAFLSPLLFSIAQVEAEKSNVTTYEENGNIFLKVVSEATQLTKNGRDSTPILSPDGKWIVYNREIEGTIKECSKRDDLWACPSDELWIIDLEKKTERLLLEPRPDVLPENTKNVIYQFNGKEFSPDSKTIYFTTPAWVVSSAIHAVNIDGTNERYITHGYSFRVVQEPLSVKIKQYLINDLEEDDWRIFPKMKGYELAFKALKDDIIGCLIIERSGVKIISSTTPLEDGWKGEDGKYYRSMGRRLWNELISPDGSKKIPIEAKGR